MEIAKFSISANPGDGFIQLDFKHSGQVARNVSLRLGILDESIARAGDGFDFDDRDRDLSVVLYVSSKVDHSSVKADYVAPIAPNQHVVVFVVWTSDSTEDVLAEGAEIAVSADGGFMHRVVSGSRALEMLLSTQTARIEHLPRVPALASADAVPPFGRLTVAGYRGFAGEATLNFAVPNGEAGSGLTLVVGSNNSGKSSFIEAIQIIARARAQTEIDFPEPRRNAQRDSVSIELVRSDGQKLEVRSLRPGGSQASAAWVPSEGARKFDIHVTPARRSFSQYFGGFGSSDRDWGLMDQEYSRTQVRDAFVGRLRAVDRDNARREVFDSLLTEIVGQPLDWTFDEVTPQQQYVKVRDQAGATHTSEGLGDGLVSLLFIVDALYDSEPGALIAIDEPELSLHPLLVRRLRKVLSRFSADRQIVIATHSPLMIDWEDIAGGASVARVYKDAGRSVLAQAASDTLRRIASLADHRNLTNPHTVGVVAREVFFREDGILLVEGQDDAIYLPRVLADLGLPETENIFGWGSGGATNTPTLAKLFLELGYRRVGVLLDDDGRPETQKAADELAGMGPEVKVRRIPAPDIRFKKAVKPRDEVIGLLERDGTRVREELREDATAALQELLAHVDGA